MQQHFRPMLMLFGFATVQTIFITVGDPLLIKWLIDTIGSGDMQLFIVVACAALLFYTLTRILDYFYIIMKARIRMAVMASFCENAAGIYFRQPYIETREHDKGYYSGRILDESQEIAGLLDTVLNVYRALLGFISALAVCLWLSWQLALAISCVVPLLLYVSRRYGTRIGQSSIEVQQTEAELRDTVGQVIGSYKLSNLSPTVTLPFRALEIMLQRNIKAQLGITRLSALFTTVSGLTLSYAEMAVLLSAGFQVIRGQLTVGGLFAFMSAYWRAVQSVQSLIDLTPQLARLDGIAQRLEEFVASAQPLDASMADSSSNISLQAVGFSFSGKYLFSDLDLQLDSGQRLLIVGANGSGKSSLIDLLCDFLPVGQGKALLPSRNLISCQFTSTDFFPGTVRDNMTAMAGEQATLWLQRCDLEAVAEQYPFLLSSGQQRKLQIAMTLAKNAEYYFFDEPLSNLDEASRQRFFDLILEHTAGKALIVVMHGEDKFHRHFDRKLNLSEYSGRRDGIEP